IQRLLKLAINRSAHADTVFETLDELKRGLTAYEVLLKKDIKTLRNRSAQWLVNGFKAINKEEIVKNAFRFCAVGDLNLSYESLTSLETKRALLDLRQSDPEFYAEITSGRADEPLATSDSDDFPE
ncbi:uncharacterized protein B0H18DRAFT_852976, partial [Fomitopsis serialis]|uniref:uncharacterized protein n=1 Tax=Fomitopsis serialis TaxID=139415 RepID=UPI00200822E3